MAKSLYELEYKKSLHFSFGVNWRDFLATITPKRVTIAKMSLKDFLGGPDCLEGKTFIDVGCGSGLFSLAAHRMNAKRVVSVDIDEVSLECVNELKTKEGNPKNWDTIYGSILNRKFVKSLGRFDVVYAWGVLHHTGDMEAAIKNVIQLVSPSGTLFIAIYNKYCGFLQGSSQFWLSAKRYYNASSPTLKSIYFYIYMSYLWLGLFIVRKTPWRYIANYQNARGMSWRHDLADWLGGYPYEFASASEVVARLMDLGFVLTRIHRAASIGCNEYLFSRQLPPAILPSATVLMAVHNGGYSLKKALKSIEEQTVGSNVVCVDDASTDATGRILKRWQTRLGKRFRIITNPTNLGLTKSLNIGLGVIRTDYVARIDADDWWEPAKLEKQLNFLGYNRDCALLGSWYINHGHTKQAVMRPPFDNDELRKVIVYSNPFAHSSVVYKTDLVKKLGGYNETLRYGQDYELWLRILDQAKVGNVPQVLCHRWTTGGISTTKQKEQMASALKTRWRYIRRHQLGLPAYRGLIEPALIVVIPTWVARLKRRLLG